MGSAPMPPFGAICCHLWKSAGPADAGHNAHVERPEKVWALFESFLESTPSEQLSSLIIR
jgi:hypothetical protein